MNIKKCPPVARMQAWRRLRHWSMPSSITLCSILNHASIRFCLNSSTSCTFSGRLTAPYFEINVLWSGLFSGQKSGSSYKSLTLLHFWSGSSEWCTEYQGKHSSWKYGIPVESIKNGNVISQHIQPNYQTASDAWRYNNLVCKLMTDKLQLMLINVLLDQFLNIKVSQGSVVFKVWWNL